MKTESDSNDVNNENGEITVYERSNDEKQENAKKDTNPNSETQDVKIFRCVEVGGKDFVDDVENDESTHEWNSKGVGSDDLKGDQDNVLMKRVVKINGQSAKASIRTSLGVNLISINYVEKKGLTWKHPNKDNEVVGYVPSAEVDIDGVKVDQKFHVKRELGCDVILGMPWVMKTRCSFEWKDGKCYCMIRTGFEKATFEISDENLDEYAMNKGNIMKSDDQRENEFVDIRCIEREVVENDGTDEEDEKYSDGKDNDIMNMRRVVLEDNEAEFDDNGGEAADGRVNESEKDYRENKIENEKVEQKAFVHCQSLGKMNCGNGAHKHECEDRNERCIGLKEAYVSQPSTMRALNGMLMARDCMNAQIRLNELSYRRTNNGHLMFGSSTLQSAYIRERYKSIKAGMWSTPNIYGDKDHKKGVGWSKWDVACCGKVKSRKWMGQRSLRHDVKGINFYKRLYLDEIVGCSSEKLISAVF
ncbi:921_t:CDS:2, partial [Dentiscutata heterogama]